MENLTRSDFEALDRNDVLADFAKQYYVPEDHIYMVGNSLGVMPKAVKQRMDDVLEKEWADDLVSSWNCNHWFELPYRIGNKIAQIIGADDGEVVVTDSVSVNLFKLVAAALNIQKGTSRSVILSEKGNFPTDLYVMQGLTAMLGPSVKLVTVEREEIEDAITQDTAVVLLTDVHYRTGHLLDKKRITELAQSKGALVIWDLCHSAGALPVYLNDINADMATGCGYKYLSGGPGAPSFVFVAKRWHDALEQPLSGWWGHATPFEFTDDYSPARGIGQMLCGTQGVLGLSALEVAIDVFLTTDMLLIREKSSKMTDLFLRLIAQQCSSYNFEIKSPQKAAERGSHIALGHPNGYQIIQALSAHSVKGDFRAPDTLRFGLTPLTLKYVDIWDAVSRLKDIMKKETWKDPKYNLASKVT